MRLWRRGSTFMLCLNLGVAGQNPRAAISGQGHPGGDAGQKSPDPELDGRDRNGDPQGRVRDHQPLDRAIAFKHEPQGDLPAIGVSQHRTRGTVGICRAAQVTTLDRSRTRSSYRLTTPRRPGLRPWPR